MRQIEGSRRKHDVLQRCRIFARSASYPDAQMLKWIKSSLQGVWNLFYTALHRAERERVGRHPDPSTAILDSQSVKTVEESARIRGYDAHTCVKGRKRHLLVDTLGLPIAHYVTPADVHDTVVVCAQHRIETRL
jgi:hypothetical protein